MRLASAAKTNALPVWAAFLAALMLHLFCAAPCNAAAAPFTLSWNTNSNRVTADVTSSDLVQVLKRIAAHTGWQVFMEPGMTHSVSAKFKDIPSSEALRFLLGDVSFAVIPASNRPPKLLVFRTGSQSATELVRAETAPAKPKAIPNELIVRLKPGANIDEIAKLLGAKVVGKIGGLNAYRLQFEDEKATASAREQLATNQEVESVDDNYSIDRPPNPVGLQAGAAPLQLQMRPPPDSGRVIVGLVDTAVQPLGNGLDQFLLKQISVAGAAQLDPSTPSHGTAMAETILRSLQGMNKGATSVQILPIDIYGAGESTSTFSVAQGIVEAVNGGAKVINLSLGSAGDSPILHDVVRNASQANILLIGAAGNEPTTTPYYPAAYPEVKAVTALDNGQIAPYASRGSFVVFGAPGLSLIPFGNLSYGVQGTSVSSAFVSGAAAGFLEVNRGSLSQAQGFLQNSFGFGTRR